jgi:hypothetical protein
MTVHSHHKTIAGLLEDKMGWSALKIERALSGGVGVTWQVTAQSGRKPVDLVVKFTELPVRREQESVDDRVYGAWPVNLGPAHGLLKDFGIPTYDLMSYGQVEKGVYFQLMSRLSGRPFGECLADSGPAEAASLQALAGEALGRLHRITRSFEGWAALPRPYAQSWKEAFFESLQNRLKEAGQLGLKTVDQRFGRLGTFIVQQREAWTDPVRYVFSHTDGMQAMFDRKGSGWVLSGHYDVEDYKFADQRFVLAGFELACLQAGQEVAEPFWFAYLKHKKLEIDYAGTKGLFKLYFLLSWLCLSPKGWGRKVFEEQIDAVLA